MLKCDRCILLFKTAGLLRRHLKEQHGIKLNSIPDNQDGARSLPQQEGRNSESAKIKCDQCAFKARGNIELIAHLDELPRKMAKL